MRPAAAVLAGITLAFVILAPAGAARAHPADVYTHSIRVDLKSEGISIAWEMKPGPMLVSYLWFEADADGDESVSAEEARAWAEGCAALLAADVEGAPLSLAFDGVDFPSTRDGFQSGSEAIVIHLSAAWPAAPAAEFGLSLHNAFEEAGSLNWYTLAAQDGLRFRMPQQRNSRIAVRVIPAGFAGEGDAPLLTAWDSSMPMLAAATDPLTQAAERVVPELAESTPQDMLLDLVRRNEVSPGFYAFALGISLFLGALHALTPGHGKTVVAAYLVGARGTTRHAIALGSVVTLTHTGSVFLLGVVTLAASQYILPTSIIPMLEILSGLLILGLGLVLLGQRLRDWRRARAHALAHAQGQDHDHPHGHGHDHGHSHGIPQEITWRSLIALGVSGGLVPCPDAIAILLVAVAINRVLLGLALIVSFSLGLAVVLIVIGLLMVNGRRLFDRLGAFERVAPVLPMLSALVVLALGLALTWGAWARAAAGDGEGGLPSEAKILYLQEGPDRVRRLFLVDGGGGEAVALAGAGQDVVDYAPSPDGSGVIYIVLTEDSANEIWLAQTGTPERRKLAECLRAICSQPAWSPDGRRVVYEHMSLDAANPTGLATLWWLDLGGGEAQPVFAEDQLPGANPRWSPDGRWLSYATPENIRLYNLETGEVHVIEGLLGSPANWSPQGASILYRDVILRENQFITQLFRYDLDSRTRTNLIPQPGFENILAAWSPDGEWVAAVRRDLSIPRGDQIWVMRPDGREARPLTASEALLHGSLNWSPEGDRILYDAYRLDSVPLESGLQVVEVDSGVVTDLGIGGYNPRWIRPE